MTYKRLLIVIISILFLQSCGLKFWYNRLDWVILWQIDDYVELNSNQEDRLESLINKHLDWHRETQLPLYISLIEQLEQDFKQGTVEAKYEEYQQSLIGFYQTISDRLVEDLVSEISQLDNEQVIELMENLNQAADKRSEKRKKRSQEDILEDIEDDIADGYSDWIGRLSKKQKALITEWVSQMQTTYELRQDSAAQWRTAFTRALDVRGTITGKDKIASLLTDPRQFQAAELKQRSAENQALEKRHMMNIYQSLNSKQRKKFLRKLNNYKEDFLDLIDDD